MVEDTTIIAETPSHVPSDPETSPEPLEPQEVKGETESPQNVVDDHPGPELKVVSESFQETPNDPLQDTEPMGQLTSSPHVVYEEITSSPQPELEGVTDSIINTSHRPPQDTAQVTEEAVAGDKKEGVDCKPVKHSKKKTWFKRVKHVLTYCKLAIVKVHPLVIF